MEGSVLYSKCKINTNVDADTFVGISYDNGDITVSFPLGFHLAEGDSELRKDIFLLIQNIVKYSDHQKSALPDVARKFHDEVSFPIQAYLYLIRDFIEHGYYRETEHLNVKSKRGKINWARTIKTQRAYIQGESAVYLDYITRQNQISSDELITLIHEFCVYESYEKMGWLFTSQMPQKPRIKFQKKLFTSFLKTKLNTTFNDRNRELFQNMLAVVSWLGDKHVKTKFVYGTNRFEYIWEKMIDRVYGVKDKEKYFPHTSWNINNKIYRNKALEPDTIMLYQKKVFVLDAKYYKYGATKHSNDLPESTSINKQITYAEYIAESGQVYSANSEPVVYNAFILPFDSLEDNINGGGQYQYIGYASGDWKVDGKQYENVQGILLDVKYLMQCTTEHDIAKIEELSCIIESHKNESQQNIYE